MKFYLVNEKYLDFLRTSESKIMNGSSKYRGDKFVLGIVLKINSINYYAPISSIKPYQLKNELTLTKECRKTCFPIIADDHKIDKILSTIRLDFMFPVPITELKELDINNLENKIKWLIQKEYQYITSCEDEIYQKANDIYNKAVIPTHFLHNKCCDFKLLEVKHQEWILLKENNK